MPVLIWKYRVHIALIVLAVGAFLWLQAHDAKIRKECEYKQAVIDIEGVKNSAKIEHKNRQKSDPDLDNALRRWVQ